MAAATPMPVGRASQTRAERKAPSVGWRTVPDSYFERLPFCLSPAAYIVVGQLLFWTRWGPSAKHPEQQRDWFTLLQESWAEKLRLSSGGLRAALKEAEDAGCIETRQVGREQHYAVRVEGFATAPLRPLTRKGNPAPDPQGKQKEDQARLKADLVHPGGDPCPIQEVVEMDDGTISNKPLLQSKGLKGKHRISTCGIRPELRGLVGSLMKKVGRPPTEDELVEIERFMEGGSIDQLRVLIQQRAHKITSYRYLYPLAKECAQSKAAWEREHVPQPPSPARGPVVEAPMRKCSKCGRETLYADRKGLCGKCGDLDEGLRLADERLRANTP